MTAPDRPWTDADVARARAWLAELASRLSETSLEDANGHTGVQVRRTRYAWLQVDHHGDNQLALLVKAPPGEQQALVQGEPDRYFVPSYLGTRGWVGANLDPAADPDWDELAALLEQAWRMTAGKRLVAAFEAGRPPTGSATGE